MLTNINIKGITIPAELEITVKAAGIHPVSGVQAIGISGEAELLRSDWEFNDLIPEVSDQISLEFHMEFELSPESVIGPSSELISYP